MHQWRLGSGKMPGHRIYSASVASVYPFYIAKAEKKGRTKGEVDEIIRWLTGHSQETLEQELASKTSFEDFFANAPRMNPARSSIRSEEHTSELQSLMRNSYAVFCLKKK